MDLGFLTSHPLPLLMDSYRGFFFSQKRSYKSEYGKKKGVKFRFTDNNEAYFIEDIPLMDTYID